MPLFGVVGRLTPQKGFDVLAHGLPRLLDWDVQMVLLGTGRHRRRALLRRARAGSAAIEFRAVIGFDDGLAHRIEAGSDFFLMPSRFEPCGLNQMYSLRYGTCRSCARTGGLVDTVDNYDERRAAAPASCSTISHPEALANTIGWALSTYYDRPAALRNLQRRGMEQDFSWERAAAELRRAISAKPTSAVAATPSAIRPDSREAARRRAAATRTSSRWRRAALG